MSSSFERRAGPAGLLVLGETSAGAAGSPRQVRPRKAEASEGACAWALLAASEGRELAGGGSRRGAKAWKAGWGGEPRLCVTLEAPCRETKRGGEAEDTIDDETLKRRT